MADFFTQIEGTSTGAAVAAALALFAAFMHAVYGAMQKGRYDPWLTRISFDLSYGVIMLPFALFIAPWPEPHMWLIFAGIVPIHYSYKYLMARAYEAGDYTLVYPIVRGSGPLLTVLFAGVLFAETFTFLQWVGVFCLSGGILALAFLGRRRAPSAQTRHALIAAFLCGITTAAYTNYDAYGIRATADPFTFLTWFFVIDGFSFPLLTLRRWVPAWRVADKKFLHGKGLLGGVIAILSFGSVMLATRIDKVGEAAVLRETSVVFAGLIGFFWLRESMSASKAALLCLIAAGAVLMKIGGL